MRSSLAGPSGESTSLLRHYVEDLGAPSSYRDRGYPGSEEEFRRDLALTATLYIGNLSFYTVEEQILALFAKCGPVKRIIMGLDRHNKTPCGFCFVEYFERKDALLSKKFLDGSKLDDRFIRVDLDPGFREGRQFGRGRSGGQVRDEMRDDYDAGRGGWGGRVLENDGAPAEGGADQYDRYESAPSHKRSRGDHY